ncbi:ester hydrolase C11orf54-like [Amphiura filiformis]|uniref:ester hydrolase C11orf54-like n=1 Tax=Amphiura filiformis TaxID=82378 RepID=UPI003B226EB0
MADKYPVEQADLHIPELQELARVLQDGLGENFESVSVNVVDCPDLTQEPFTLAASGICGKSCLADAGGPPYLIPTPQINKTYSIDKIANEVGMPGAFALGAGAGHYQYVGTVAELMPNVQLGSECTHEKNLTHMSKVIPEDDSYKVEKYQSTNCSLMVNLFLSEGKPGKVLEIKASKRKGPENFVTCMRKTLQTKYGDKPVGMGGTFVMEKGKAKIHIMPEFSKTPITSNEDVNNWLKFYEMKAPLIALSVFVSNDPGLDLRVEHSHCFSHHGDGGHYHYDVTPDEVSYLGYYVPAEKIYRVDRPQATHKIGRDD